MLKKLALILMIARFGFTGIIVYIAVMKIFKSFRKRYATVSYKY